MTPLNQQLKKITSPHFFYHIKLIVHLKRKASKGYKTPLEALAWALSGKPLLAWRPRVKVKG
jgi:hypothetical protein